MSGACFDLIGRGTVGQCLSGYRRGSRRLRERREGCCRDLCRKIRSRERGLMNDIADLRGCLGSAQARLGRESKSNGGGGDFRSCRACGDTSQSPSSVLLGGQCLPHQDAQ